MFLDCLEHFSIRPYLEATRYTFQTNYGALKLLSTVTAAWRGLRQWRFYNQKSDLNIIHRNGINNQEAHTPSRFQPAWNGKTVQNYEPLVPVTSVRKGSRICKKQMWERWRLMCWLSFGKVLPVGTGSPRTSQQQKRKSWHHRLQFKISTNPWAK